MPSTSTAGCSKAPLEVCKGRQGCTWVKGKGCRRTTSNGPGDVGANQQLHQQRQGQKQNPCRKANMTTCRGMPKCVWIPRKGCNLKKTPNAANGTAYHSVADVPAADAQQGLLQNAHQLPLPLTPALVSQAGTHAAHQPQNNPVESFSVCNSDFKSYVESLGGMEGVFRRFVRPPIEIKNRMRILGAGAYGLVLSTSDLEHCYAYFKRREARSAPLLGKWVGLAKRGAVEVNRSEWSSPNGIAAVKVQVIRGESHLKDAIVEDAFHVEIMKNPLLRDYVPKLYAGFTICSKFSNTHAPPASCIGHMPGMVFRITIMEQLTDYVTFCKFSYNSFILNPVPEAARKKVLDEMRQLLLRLWSAGITHGDLHCNNIMVNPQTLELKLLDFGMAARLHPVTAAKCKATLLALQSGRYDEARQAYRECERSFMQDAKTIFKDYNWYHPDPNMLRVVRLWAENPASKIYTAILNPSSDPPPTWLNTNMQRIRNAPNLNVFFNK